MTNNCPPHQWDENGAQEGIVLAKCLKCDTRQWHATDGDWNTIKEANQRNKRDHLELIPLKEKIKFMDTSLKREITSETPQGVSNDPPVPSAPLPVTTIPLLEAKPAPVVDSRIARMRLNTGNSERFDKLAQQVIEDVKTMAWSAALRKNGIPVGSAGRLRRRWEHMGLIAKPQTPEKEPPKTEENKSTRRDYDAEKTEILRDYYGLSLKDFYAKQHLESNKWGQLKKRWAVKGIAPHRANKTNRKADHPLREDTLPTYLCPYCETNWSQADALIKHLQTVHYAPPKMALPPWNEAWGDTVKIKWFEITWEIWRAGKYGLLDN
jgi:hypothetical protein